MNAINPSFLCIGAQKAGTTWLYRNLKSNPHVHLPPLKEIHYFDEIYKNEKTKLYDRITAKEGMNKWVWQDNCIKSFKKAIAERSISNLAWCTRYFFYKRDFKWYQKLFHCRPGQISGDITPDYCILNEETVRRIKENLPHLKILYIIRDPVDRAWSALKMRYVKRRNYAIEDIDAAKIDEYYRLFHRFNDYIRTIRNWTKFFPDNQFQVFFFDELSEEPTAFFHKVSRFLEINAENAQPIEQKKGNLRAKVHQGIKANIPSKVKKILCEKNIDQLLFLNDYFRKSDKNYPQRWLRDAYETMKIDYPDFSLAGHSDVNRNKDVSEPVPDSNRITQD